MGVATDKSLVGLTTAVNNISTSGMSDTTGQAIVSAINGLSGAISPAASNVTFDNTGTGLSASNVQTMGAELASYKLDASKMQGVISYFTLANGASITIDLTTKPRSIIFFSSYYQTAKGIYAVGVISSGSVSGQALVGLSGLTFDTSTNNQLTITNGSGAFLSAWQLSS